MKELTKVEVREIVLKVAGEMKLKEVFIPQVVNSAIYVAIGEIIRWDDSVNAKTSLFDEEIGLYANPNWGELRPDWVFEDEDYDFEYHFQTVEEAVHKGAKQILEQQTEEEVEIEA